MHKDRRAIWVSVSVAIGIVLMVIAAFPLWMPLVDPYWPPRVPRNQRIQSDVVERLVTVGMTWDQVQKVLHLPADTMSTCTRPAVGGGTEVEIVGSSPPWLDIPDGNHSLVLDFDKRGRVVSGYGIWYCPNEDDTDVLALEPGPK